MHIVSRAWRDHRALIAAMAMLVGGAAAAHADITRFNSGVGWTSSHSGGYAPQFTSTTLQLTSTGTENQAASAFYNIPQVVVGGFGLAAEFIYQQTSTADPSAPGDGIAFVLQNSAAGASALGSNGGSIGYEGIDKSLAVVLDLNQGSPRIETTGLGTGGSYDDGNGFATSPVVLSSGHPIQVNLAYVIGTDTLNEKLWDMTTNSIFMHSYVGVGVPGLLGGNNAFVGFTGATGQNDDTQIISDLAVGAIDAPEPSFAGVAVAGLVLLAGRRAKRRSAVAVA